MRKIRAAVLYLLIPVFVLGLLTGCRVPLVWDLKAKSDIKETVTSYLDAVISGNRNIAAMYVEGDSDPVSSLAPGEPQRTIAPHVITRMSYTPGEITLDSENDSASFTVSITAPDVMALWASDTIGSYDVDSFVADVDQTEQTVSTDFTFNLTYNATNKVWYITNAGELAAYVDSITGSGIVFREITDAEAVSCARNCFQQLVANGYASTITVDDVALNGYINEIVSGMQYDAEVISSTDTTKTVRLTVTRTDPSALISFAFTCPEELAQYAAEQYSEVLTGVEGDTHAGLASLYSFLESLVPDTSMSTVTYELVITSDRNGELVIDNPEVLNGWADPYLEFPTDLSDDVTAAAILWLRDQGRLSYQEYAAVYGGEEGTPAAIPDHVPASIDVPEFTENMQLTEGESNNVFDYEFLDNNGTSVGAFYTTDESMVIHITTSHFYDPGTAFYYNVYKDGEARDTALRFEVTEEFSDDIRITVDSEGGFEEGDYVIVIFDPGRDSIMATVSIHIGG